MPVGPQSSTKFELRSGYEEELAKQLGHQSLQSYYESLLLSGKQEAAQVAQQQYQMGAESAAQKASYDISAAYANYLKQQRNVMSQSHLESGYKQEVGDILQEQYGSAYQQAKVTQAQNVATAVQQASKTYSDIYSDAESRAKTILGYYQKQAATKASLYKFIEEQAGYDLSTSPWYTSDDGLELTPYGQEQIRRYLLENADAVTHGLEEAGLEDELAYYLSDPHGVRSELFGIEEDVYNYASAQSVGARLSEQKLDDQTKTYQEIIYNKALEKFNQNDVVGIFDVYRTEYGMTDDEIKEALLPEVTNKSERDRYTLENALNIALRRGDSKKANLQQVHDLLTQKAKTKK